MRRPRRRRPERPRWWRRRSLRLRLTVLAAVTMAVGLLGGAVLLVWVTTRSMLATVDGSALRTATEIAQLVTTGRLPDPLPVVGSAGEMVQVVDGDGFVRAASATADHLVPMLDREQTVAVRGGARLLLHGDETGLAAPVRVVGVVADTGGQRRTVVVAVSVAQLRRAVLLETRGLAVGAPLLLVAVTAVAWVVIGSTLRPVAALRRGAEEIGGGGRRLPLPESTDEIRRLAETLNRMLARVEEGRRQQRAFVSDAAHELRSPLASIRTQLEVAQRLGELGAGGDEVVPEVMRDVERLSRLVDDLLALARLDEQQPELERPEHPGVAGAGAGAAGAAGFGARRRQRVDLAAEVTAVVGWYGGARVPVHAEVAGGPLVVLAEVDGVRRIVTNLLDNAVRHARSAVTVTVSVASGHGGDDGGGDDRMVRVRVTDDGPGVPEAERERVFDRFARRDDARDRDQGGTGLGLPISRGLARAYGGEVSLVGGDGGGLTAQLVLPAAEPSP